MSTPQEKIEAQRLAFVDHHNYHLRHMVGPKELERLLEAAAAENPQKLPIEKKAPTAVALRRLVRRLRRVSEIMRQVGADMEYHGGCGEIGEHGRCMVGASQMTKLWADGIASDVEIATITK